MLETSKDLLFITIAFCALLFTGVICILIWQFISIIGNVRGIMSGVRQKLDLIDDVVKTLKEKIQNSAGYVVLIVKAVEKIVDHLQGKRAVTKTAKKDKAK